MQIAGVELKRALLGWENVAINSSLHCVSSHCTTFPQPSYYVSSARIPRTVYLCFVYPCTAYTKLYILALHCQALIWCIAIVQKLQLSVYFAHPPTFPLTKCCYISCLIQKRWLIGQDPSTAQSEIWAYMHICNIISKANFVLDVWYSRDIFQRKVASCKCRRPPTAQ